MRGYIKIRNKTFFVPVAVAIVIIVLFFVAGPFCFVYDLNHLLPLVTNQKSDIHSNPFTILGGWVFSEFVIPLAVLVWILVGLGVLS